MYKKMALSLADTYEIHVIGFKSEIPDDGNVNFHPIFNFDRLSIKRIFAPINFLFLLINIKPKIVVVCTHELIEQAIFYKLISGAKIIYDIQENYYLNALHSGNFINLVKVLVAYKIRLTEWVYSPFISQFFLAEKTYINELPFIGNKYQVFENLPLQEDMNFPKKEQNFQTKNEINIIYSGTIAESYGIFDAISFTEKIHSFNSRLHLKIIGYSAQKGIIKKVKKLIANKPYITLFTSEIPLAHDKILEAIHKADLAILPYKFNKSTENRIPTKIWECIALQAPIIITENNTCEKIIKHYNAGISVNFNNFNSTDWSNFLNSEFYTNSIEIPYWDREKFGNQLK